MKRFIGLHLDFLGFIGSVLCAIHCALLPVLFGLGVLNSSFLYFNHSFELAFIFAALLIALASLTHGFRKHHHNIFPMIISIFGFALVFLNHDHSSSASSWVMVIAGLLIATAHMLNWRFINYVRISKCT